MIRLSEEQLAASQALSGAIRVVAGAGTGKTAVIAERYRRLVGSGVSPESILVMTFSERAAAQMRERICEATGLEDTPHVGTFHALALRWLREEAGRIGLSPGFRILAGAERWIFMRELMWELGHPALVGGERPDDLVHSLLKLQERLKQELVPLNRLAAAARRVADPGSREELLGAVQLFLAHAERSRRQRLLDFDDLLLRTVAMLERHPDIRARYSARFAWLMVDEFQDTNLAQERMVELLAGPVANVCVVGDDDQSIYRFRGASRASMERFLASFPGSSTHALGRNRRSSRPVVEAARALIEHNPDRLPKPLSSGRPAPAPPVELWEAPDAGSEAAAIAAEAGALNRAGIRLSRIAVLCRTHAIAHPIVEGLERAGVAHQHRAGQGLFRRPEVRDLVAYLRLLDDPSDLHAMARLVTRPPLGLDLERFLTGQGAGAEGGSLRALAGDPIAADWATVIGELVILKAELGVDELLFELLNRTAYLDHATVLLPGPETERVIANVSRFAELVEEYCERRRDHSLSLFVEYVRLVLLSGIDEEMPVPNATVEAVQVMSIHQAKGLEFDAVFIPALVEGRLPQPRRREQLDLPPEVLEPAVRGREDHLAEERRLCYVAMTRARERLYLTRARRYEGTREWRPSRFLAELGPGPSQRQIPPAAGEPGPAPQGVATAGMQVRAGANGVERPLLSFSGVSSYRECPRQYWYRYRLRLPPLPVVEAQFGTVLHEALMRAGRLRADGREVALDRLRDLYLDAWEGMSLAEPRRRSTLEAIGWRLLENFHTAGGLAGRPHLVETSFTTDLDTWTLRGIIDRVDPPPPPTQEGGGRASEPSRSVPEGSGASSPSGSVLVGSGEGAARAGAWRIIDYKTGAPVPAGRLKRDLQLGLYALGARAALGLDPVELEIAYLRDGRRVRVEAGDELLAEAERAGAEVAEGVRRGRFQPRPERRRCSLCSYRLVCEAAL